MMSKSSLAFLLCAPAVAILRGTGHQSMRPDAVAHLLQGVEETWTKTHLKVLRNASDDASAYASMEPSCAKVSMSIIQGSDGDKDRVVEYMQDVCSHPVRRCQCRSFRAQRGIRTVLLN